LAALLLFALWVALEVVALGLVIAWTGVLGALLLAALSSTGGYLMLRGEGIALAARLAAFMRHAERTGEVPPLPLAQSLPRFIAGLLLLIPGFFTDVLAALVLLPPVRDRVVRKVQRVIIERHHAVLRERGIVDVPGAVMPEGGALDDDSSEDERDGGAPEAPPPPPKFGGKKRFTVP
jgi:UPF0716 protein FxsA